MYVYKAFFEKSEKKFTFKIQKKAPYIKNGVPETSK